MRGETVFSMEELVPVVTELAQRYTGYESTSVTYEKAQQLMDAVLYCIHESGISGEKSLCPENLTAKETYQMGLQQVIEKVKKMRELYNHIISGFQAYGNECLYDTVVKGIPEFLKWYDVQYAPQNTILTLDYPVLLDLRARSGIDAVFEYVQCITLEQQFLQTFPDVYVQHVLAAYSEDYKILVENIFEIVLQNAAAHILLKKPFMEEGFTGEEYAALAKRFAGKTKQEVEALLFMITEGIIQNVHPNQTDAESYYHKAAADIGTRIRQDMEFGTMERVFLK